MKNADRLDRIEAALENLVGAQTRTDAKIHDLVEAQVRTDANLDRFELLVRGAITAQQEQIAALTRAAQKHDEAIANLERQWQAYLGTIHPKQ